MWKNRALVFLFGGLLLAASGCASRKTVQAVVTLDGKAVVGAMVVLVPADEKGDTATGQTTGDGSVTLTTIKGEGVRSGTYKVPVTKTAQPGAGGNPKPGSKEAIEMMKAGAAARKSELPEVYASAATTPLSLKVPPDTTPAKIELKSTP